MDQAEQQKLKDSLTKTLELMRSMRKDHRTLQDEFISAVKQIDSELASSRKFNKYLVIAFLLSAAIPVVLYFCGRI